ncbi:Leaf rust 10 disease-resistance locus receptor-like protein kinase, partial [Thalictrum thalictroides]
MNIFFSNLPVSLSVDDPRYIDCARTSVCGDIKSITYPFWGIDRAEHCGHPDFKLKCQNDLLEIEIQSQNYRVISMNTSDRILRIATMSYCTSLSISGDYHLFYYYTPTTQSLTLFNNCPLVQGLNTTDKFNCSINANATNNYFWIDYTPETAPFPNLIQCQVKITVPVLRHLVNLTLHGFNKSSLSLDEVLRMGFDVEYVMDVSECKSCKSSGGECGYDVKAGQPTCFCRDSRQYQGRCSTQP